MQRPRAQPAPDVISDVTVVEPRRRLPSTARQAVAADLAAAAAAVASYRFTVGPDEAFPQPPSPLVRPKNSSSGQHFVACTHEENPYTSKHCCDKTWVLLPRDAVLSAAYAVVRCLSVRLFRWCIVLKRV